MVLTASALHRYRGHGADGKAILGRQRMQDAMHEDAQRMQDAAARVEGVTGAVGAGTAAAEHSQASDPGAEDTSA